MNKKLIVFNLIVIGLILLFPIINFCWIHSSSNYTFWDIYYQTEYHEIIYILIGIIIFSSLISLFKYSKLINVNLVLTSVFFMIIIGVFINDIIKLKKEEKEYIERAKEDIKNDKIIFLHSGGFPLPEFSSETYAKIDSIHNKYGVDYINIGVLDFKHDKLELKYEETVKPYLEKRNGKDWKKRMQKELDAIKKEKLY
ncbi:MULTISPECIES: hypothetical protein [Empedobacter]|uniref:FEKKY domain-containing protein n=1 Tax=Empedobacter TaxID=59734 RepID=UPI001C570A28|nr:MULTISPECIES: hypothetical protein [Empedobacter]MBW1619242.1 hypothetical protein [Empedobacter falsenii]